MTRRNRWQGIISWIFLMMHALPNLALPTYEQTILPFPNRIDAADKFMAAEVTNLVVYQDSKDPHQYYYVPPFHIRQYRQGAAGMLLHNHNIRQYAEAKETIDGRDEYAARYSQERLLMLTERINYYEGLRINAEQQYEEALASNDPNLALWEDQLRRHVELCNNSIARLERAEQLMETVGNLLPASLKRSYNTRIMYKFAAAGFGVSDNGIEDPDIVYENLKTALDDFSETYGGYLSFNAYGGFSRAQLDALIAYKTKYMPHIKISLLPIEKLTFFGLTESKQYASKGTSATTLFGQVNGAGDYLGAAIIMDITLAGAMGLVEHLAPFVPPVGIKATFKQQMEPAEAELDCDFSSGFLVNGRSDVRDGLIVFDNDVTIKLNAQDHSRGGCHLKHISGDLASAEYLALTELEKELETAHLRRTSLAHQEKEKYYKGVIDDIHHNRRDSRGKIRTISRLITQNGWQQSAIVELASQAADFHWHTNVQNVSNISNLKFHKRISVRGHKTIEKELPLNLCLVWNPDVQAYDRCSEIDDREAINMQTAMKQAFESTACKDIADPIECGKQRDKEGIPRHGRGSSIHDHNFSEEI